MYITYVSVRGSLVTLVYLVWTRQIILALLVFLGIFIDLVFFFLSEIMEFDVLAVFLKGREYS